jgi:hypothetical protein
MKRQIYKSGSRSNKTFIYQVKFGKLLPLVILSSEPEYFRIKTRFELLRGFNSQMQPPTDLKRWSR